MKIPSTLRRTSIALLLSLLILSALSLARFNQSLWLDEGSSVWFARLPFSTILTSLCDPHPAGYYAFLKTWMLASDSEVWLRVPSLIAALLGVLLTFQIGQEHGGPKVALLAAIFLALNPLQAWYGSEVRMYAAAQTAGLVMVWLGWRLIAGSTRRLTAAAYLLVTMAALWIDYTVFLPWCLLQLIWITRNFPQARRWLVLQAASLIPTAVGLLFTNQLSSLRQGYQPIFLAIQSSSLGLPLTPASAAALLQVLIILAALWCLALAWHWRTHTFLGSTPARSVVVVLWIALVVLSIVPRGFTLKRILVVMLPYLALATACIVTRWPASVIKSLIVIEAVAAVISVAAIRREPWRAIVTDLVTTQQPAVTVWVDDLAVPVFDYYARRAASSHLPIDWTPLIGSDLPRIPGDQPPANTTLAIVTSENQYRHLTNYLPVDFYANYELLTQQREPGIGVNIYRRRELPDSTAAIPTHSPTDAWGLLIPSPLSTCQP